MPTPNKDNVEKLMKGFEKALSERDIEMLVGMAQEGEEEKEEKGADLAGFSATT